MARTSSPKQDNVITARQAAEYLFQYTLRYRKEYARFVASPPDGCGYPPLVTSPYLNASVITGYLTRDGCAILDSSDEPNYRWEIAGGPAWLVDREPTYVPKEIETRLRLEGLYGKDIGIYRIVPKSPLTEEIRIGQLPRPVSEFKKQADSLTEIVVKAYEISFSDLITRLTLGAIGPTLVLHVPSANDAFWAPTIIRGLGIATADRKHKTWLNYLELLGHSNSAAWDRRSIWARVSVDVRRDFLHATAKIDRPGAAIAVLSGPPSSASGPEAPLDLIRATTDKLDMLGKAIDGFARLLSDRGDEVESVFHRYLASHPVLLDVYGVVESKPRFTYPAGESPTGKGFVEPDFLIRYPADNTYKLVELERPNKGLATKHGEPRHEVGQATFQIAEWKDYIQNHYELLKARYPGISSPPRTQVVISRSTMERSGVSNTERYLAMLRQQFTVDEIITYDILLEHARTAYAQLAGAMPV